MKTIIRQNEVYDYYLNILNIIINDGVKLGIRNELYDLNKALFCEFMLENDTKYYFLSYQNWCYILNKLNRIAGVREFILKIIIEGKLKEES